MKAGRRPTAKTVKDYFSSGSGRKLWKEGQAEKENVGNGLGEFDDGKYRVKLTKAYTAMSNTSGRPQNVLTFKFLEGEYKGQSVSQYQGLDNKTGIAIALQTLAKLGHEIDSPDEIDAADKKLGKEMPEVEIRLRTRGEYQNVIISSILSDTDADADEDEEEAEDVDVEEEDAPKKKSKSDDADDEDEDSDSDKDAEGGKEADEGTDEDADDEDADEDEEEEKTSKPSKKSKKSDEDEDDADADEDKDSDDDDEEEESDEEGEDEVALEPGMKLKIKHDGEKVKAKIVKVNEKAREVKVKLADGSKITISVDDIVDVL